MKNLRIHYFQHAGFEGLGSIEEWSHQNGHILTRTNLFEDIHFPSLSDFDWLVIMGGPMSVNDEDRHPWLKEEILFIQQAIDADKTVLGICLGSQLISKALGARVYRNAGKEIGWFDIDFTASAMETHLFSDLGDAIKVFHWHGETFDLPEKVIPLASSGATKNQGFIYNDKVLAMQFHIENTSASLKLMMDNCRNDLTPGKYVQTEKQILSESQLIKSNRKILFTILDRLAEV